MENESTRKLSFIMRIRDLPDDALWLRPNQSLFWQAMFGVLAFLVPISTVLYFLTVPDGPWVSVLVSQVIVVIAFGLAVFSFRRTGFWVSRMGISERGFFGRWSYVPIEKIDLILLANTYRGSGSDTAPQLFICDTDGKQLLRMRGQFWSVDNMRLVGDALDIPITELGESVSTSELLDSHPGLLYWFEKHPLVVALVILVTVVVAAVLLDLLVNFVRP